MKTGKVKYKKDLPPSFYQNQIKKKYIEHSYFIQIGSIRVDLPNHLNGINQFIRWKVHTNSNWVILNWIVYVS